MHLKRFTVSPLTVHIIFKPTVLIQYICKYIYSTVNTIYNVQQIQHIGVIGNIFDIYTTHKTYVVHDPEHGQEGTELNPEDFDEDNLDEKIETSEGYNPPQPVLMATGDFFEEKPGGK